MASKSIAAVVLLVLGAACSPSHDRFENAREVAVALRDTGVPCRDMPARGPIIVPKDESAGHCLIDHEGATIRVLGKKDALRQLKGVEDETADETPRIYVVYGENWFIATESEAVAERVHGALGGEIADNTQF